MFASVGSDSNEVVRGSTTPWKGLPGWSGRGLTVCIPEKKSWAQGLQGPEIRTRKRTRGHFCTNAPGRPYVSSKFCISSRMGGLPRTALPGDSLSLQKNNIIEQRPLMMGTSHPFSAECSITVICQQVASQSHEIIHYSFGKKPAQKIGSGRIQARSGTSTAMWP